MRPVLPAELERARLRDGPYATLPGERRGVFCLRGPCGAHLQIMASDGADWAESGLRPPVWEHVSVRCRNRCPWWPEMVWVKDLFWDPEELVVQFHPPASCYVNCHEFVLHLWRVVGVTIALPPLATV